MSYKKACNKWYSTIHHGTAVEADFAALRAAAGTNQNYLEDAETKIRMYQKRNPATFEAKATKKVVDGLNKSSVGNHLLGWLSPKHAR